MRVLILDSRRFVREALAALLSARGHAEVVCSGTDVESLAELERDEGDVVVLTLDEGLQGERLTALRARRSVVRVIAVRSTAALRRPGGGRCDAVVDSDSGVEGILHALGSEVSFVRLPRGGDQSEPSARGILTPRELRVLQEVATGATAREIAARLRISTATVDNHKRRLFEKLGVRSQAHAVAVALQHGLHVRAPMTVRDR